MTCCRDRPVAAGADDRALDALALPTTVGDRADHSAAEGGLAETADVTTGIKNAIDAVASAGSIEVSRLSHVMLGTTHATNAVLERQRLQRVAVLRVGAPSSTAVRPMYGWPEDLVVAVGGISQVVGGGFEYTGREVVPFDFAATTEFFESAAGRVDAVAISAVFSPISNAHEIAAATIAREVLGEEIPISLSHEIGSLGLLPRENATILNAALTGVARTVAAALTQALEEHGITASVLFAQNDGTLMALEYAVRFPILTIGSGPANSIRGAAFLTGLTDAVVADVGGTSTDFGMLVNGFPRESAVAVEIGGVSTNFRMPLFSIRSSTILDDRAGFKSFSTPAPRRSPPSCSLSVRDASSKRAFVTCAGAGLTRALECAETAAVDVIAGNLVPSDPDSSESTWSSNSRSRRRRD